MITVSTLSPTVSTSVKSLRNTRALMLRMFNGWLLLMSRKSGYGGVYNSDWSLSDLGMTARTFSRPPVSPSYESIFSESNCTTNESAKLIGLNCLLAVYEWLRPCATVPSSGLRGCVKPR